MTQEKRIIMWLDHEYGEGNENVKIVREALEKQIPKKPTGSTHAFDQATLFRCANCEAIVMQNLSTRKTDYCVRCGQAIDWNGVEEESGMFLCF